MYILCFDDIRNVWEKVGNFWLIFVNCLELLCVVVVVFCCIVSKKGMKKVGKI